MGNTLTSNPVYIDTASGSDLTGMRYIQSLQWIDDNADFAADEDLVFTINGTSVAVIPHQVPAGGTIWQAGPFARPIPVLNFVVTKIDHGVLLVWLA